MALSQEEVQNIPLPLAEQLESDPQEHPLVSSSHEKDHPSYDSTTSNSDRMSSSEINSSVAYAKEKRCSNIKKSIVGLILGGFIIFVIVDSLTNKYVLTAFESFLGWIENNIVAGFFALVGVYFLATVLFIPGSILTLGSGFVFGNAVGLGLGVAIASLAVFVGASAGAIVAFLLGRFLLRDWAKGYTEKYPLIRAVDASLEDKGLRIFILLRLSPIVPFNALNYVAGVTAVKFRHYALAMFAILPGTVLYCFIGASAGSLADSGAAGPSGTTQLVIIIVGVVLGLGAIFAVSYYAKKELNKIAESDVDAAAVDVELGEGEVDVGRDEQAHET